MAQTLTRTPFHSSQLVRELAHLSVLDEAAPGAAFAQQLAQWVDFKHAIGLSSVNNAAPVAAMAPATSDAYTALQNSFAKASASMERTLANAGTGAPGRSRNQLPRPDPGASVEEARAYTPYRRYHQAQQRELEQSANSLRATMREGVAKACPRLAQLVALDAAFDDILCEREAKLLSTITTLLERRFNHLYRTHVQGLVDRRQQDNVDQWCRSGGWLTHFHQELQAVLLAEWDLRLQPTLGLLEALHHETTQQR